ncbi:MAG: TetR/AcrR family transcriptional regulator [Arcobacteraceae bacterium]
MTKQDIIDVAIKEFAKYGFTGLSMSQLSSALGITKPAIYYHFKNKQSLYDEVLLYLFGDINTKTDEILKSDLSPKEKFREYVKLEINAIRLYPEIVPISFREMAQFVSHTNKDIVRIYEKDIIDLTTLLNELNLKQRYKNVDFSLIKALIMGTVNVYYAMQISDIKLKPLHDFDKDKMFDYLAENITNIVLDALCED